MPKKRGKSKNAAKSPRSEVPPEVSGSGVTSHQSLKVCRLCEIQVGPFVNIFNPDKVISKKIQDLMPFVVAENDELPHKICFRCSAKVEELHEFVQKCIATQERLRATLAKTAARLPKTDTRVTEINKWKESLDTRKIANDDICDAVIKKAMEYMKGQHVPSNAEKTDETPKAEPQNITVETSIANAGAKGSSQTKNNLSKNENTSAKELPKNTSDAQIESDRKITRSSRSNFAGLVVGSLSPETKRKKTSPAAKSIDLNALHKTAKHTAEDNKNTETELLKRRKIECNKESATATIQAEQKRDETEKEVKCYKKRTTVTPINKPTDKEPTESDKVAPKKEDPKSFNIMDHVSIIKVNGVGVLFQCKLCNRNFLKKEVVVSHGCAKNGTPQEQFPQKLVLPRIIKAPTVKYINTKQDESKPGVAVKSNQHENVVETKRKAETKLIPDVDKPKPKIGPASKVRRKSIEPTVAMTNTLTSTSAPNQSAQYRPVQVSNAPNSNARFMLVPGRNNIYTLVDEQANGQGPSKIRAVPLESIVQKHGRPQKRRLSVTAPSGPVVSDRRSSDEFEGTAPKRRASVDQGVGNSFGNVSRSYGRRPGPSKGSVKSRKRETQVDLHFEHLMDNERQTDATQPYPVGLFQSIPKKSNLNRSPIDLELPVFGISAAQKQSYTIVDPDNPNKLLISSKPPAQLTTERLPKRAGQANPPEGSGNLTFMNIRPHQQAPYVPRQNIDQESRVSASRRFIVQDTNNCKTGQDYTCNMCTEKFSRESKLQAHIQAHYNKMDEEDLLRSEKIIRKKIKKV